MGGSLTTDQRNHNRVNEITQSVTNNLSPVTFVYDGAPGASNGNLVYDGPLVFSCDAMNRPIEIYIDYLVIGTYTYDAFNRRILKTVTYGGLPGNIPDGTTGYTYIGNQVAEERNSSNTPIRQYIWGIYVDKCIQLTTLATLGPQSLPAGTYYLLQDLLYRAVALANSSGAIVEAYDADAYGNTLIFTGPGADAVWFTDDDVQSDYGANEIIYCGYRYDPEGPGYYVRNRNYMPFLGRWIQRDPIGYAGGINLYEYVAGRAVVAVDPMGMGVTQQEVNLILNELKAELEKATAVGRGIHRIKAAIAAIQALAGSQQAQKEVTEDLLDYLLETAKDIVKGYGGALAGAYFGYALEDLKIALALAGVIYGPATRSRACNDCEIQDASRTHPGGTVFQSGTTALAVAFAFGVPVYFVRYEIMCKKDCEGRMSVLMWINQRQGYQWVACGF